MNNYQEPCMNCRHEYERHSYGNEGPCKVRGCICAHFVELVHESTMLDIHRAVAVSELLAKTRDSEQGKCRQLCPFANARTIRRALHHHGVPDSLRGCVPGPDKEGPRPN